MFQQSQTLIHIPTLLPESWWTFLTCAKESFPLANVHEHQVQFMREFEAQDGVAFLIIYFAKKDIFYYLTLRQFEVFWQRAENGGRKSFTYEELDPKYQISPYNGVPVHYLEILGIDLSERE